MFTPQQKAWPNAAVPFTPHRGGAATVSASAKGKAVADGPPPPPLGSLTETTVAVGFDTGNAEDWKRFTELGLLDESVMQRKDHEALMEKVLRLERELFDYQYNMGLLLIEKKEWNSKFDQLRQELAETEEILKREQSAHLIALFEVEKREENLRKALSTERQCGADLERALRAMQEEHAQIQSKSHTKLAEASALVDGIEEKSSVVDKKLLDAEAKLAEVNRKNAELGMKLQEVEARESLLQKERLSLVTDRELFDATFYKEREDLKEWERKLQQRENMLCNGRQNIGEKEENIVKTEKNLKQKERDLEVLEKKINSSNSILKEKEAEIIRRTADLNMEEKKVDSLKSMLEKKEKELFALESKLSSREREGIQKLLGEQKATLDLQLQQVEFEMEHKRKSLVEEFSSKEEALEQREVEVNHREKKVEKEEQALSKKAERLKEQSKEIEAKLKSLKEKEKTMKIKEKELEKDNQQLLADRESLENLNAELQKIKAEISLQELQICEETKNLKLTEDDRLENSRLQLELKQEIENTRLQKDSLVKEAESLREERQRFEKEWEVLDERREEITRKQHDIDEEKESLRKLQNSEEERLRSKKQNMQEHIKKELEKLELEKESFRDSMNQEKHLLSEKVKNEQDKMLQDFESKTRNHENEIQKRQEEIEKDLQERERNFQEEMRKELDNINILKDVTEKEWEEAKAEGIRLENERKELELNKQQLKSGQQEMHEDSEMLMNLSQKVKKERQRLVAERKHFLELVENLKSCRVCGEVVGDFVISDIELPDFKESMAIPSPISPVLNYKSPKNSQDIVASSDINNSGSVRPVSWIRKCTSKIFKLSPNKRAEAVSALDTAGTSLPSDVNVSVEKADEPASLPNIEGARVILDERQPASGRAYHSLDTPLLQSENIDKELDDEYSQSVGDHSRVDSLVDGDRDDSHQSVPKLRRGRPGKKSKSGIARTRSVKAVVEEAREFLGKTPKKNENASLQSLTTDHIKEDSREDSSHVEKAVGNTGRKRQRAQTSRVTESEQNAGDSEGQSESITAGGRRKKRQALAPPAQVTSEKRYNLRQHKIAGKDSSTRDLPNATKSVVKEAAGGNKLKGEMSPEVVETSLAAADDNAQDKSMVQDSTTKTVEVSDERVVVRFEVPRDIVDDNGAATDSLNPAEENGTPEHQNENGSTIHDFEDEDDDDDEEEDGDEEHPGASTSSDMRTEFHGNTSAGSSYRNVATHGQRNCLSEHEEQAPPCQVSAGRSGRESYSDSSNTASTSFVAQQSSDPVSVNVSANKDVVNDVNYPVVSGGVSQVSHETVHPRSSTPQEHVNFSSGDISVENHNSAFISIQNSSNLAQGSNLAATSQGQEEEPCRETIPSGLGILVSNRERGPGNDSVLQVDVVTISSNILSGSNPDANDHDARRSGRRLFWDAFSRRSSRRLGDSPTIVFSTAVADDPGSQDRWLVDFGGDLSNDGVGGASGYMGSRIHRLNERRRRHSRSEIWDRLRGGFDEIGRWNSCPLGLHADGMCSCESSPMADESSTRASISRIVMLAEALFEVLDEIHRQPGSLSLSMVSLPAPESIVDSFPLKSHKKVEVADGGNDVEQCYICLAEYEEGDQIRVLPCLHEYHMSCVDKWLKEIHGVCPLCRGNVCGGFTESSANSEVQSH